MQYIMQPAAIMLYSAHVNTKNSGVKNRWFKSHAELYLYAFTSSIPVVVVIAEPL